MRIDFLRSRWEIGTCPRERARLYPVGVDSSKSRVLVLDESLRGNVIVVGGYITTADLLQTQADTWQHLKTEVFGLAPDSELKYTLDKDHPSRPVLDRAGWNQARRVPAMLECIGEMDVLVLADALVDIPDEVRPEQFYLDALSWCLRRTANEVSEDIEGPHWAVADMPPQAGELDAGGVSNRLRELHRNVGTAAFDRYQELYREPEEFGEGWAPGTPLRQLGFAPTLHAAHARHADHLQIADAIVGCIRDFVYYNFAEAGPDGILPAPGYQEANLRMLGPRFRRGPKRVVGFGFDVFPPDAPPSLPLRKRVDEICGFP